VTAFIFMLTPDAGAAAVERVTSELEAAFPEHDFTAGQADIPDFENSILAIHGSASSGEKPGRVAEPDTYEVERVKQAFQVMLDELRGWQPS
jgi:hypothetical protein